MLVGTFLSQSGEGMKILVKNYFRYTYMYLRTILNMVDKPLVFVE